MPRYSGGGGYALTYLILGLQYSLVLIHCTHRCLQLYSYWFSVHKITPSRLPHLSVYHLTTIPPHLCYTATHIPPNSPGF